MESLILFHFHIPKTSNYFTGLLSCSIYTIYIIIISLCCTYVNFQHSSEVIPIGTKGGENNFFRNKITSKKGFHPPFCLANTTVKCYNLLRNQIQNLDWRVCMARTVAIGNQDFEGIITNHCFYIDKTNFIKEWWEAMDAVTLITRPRRLWICV